MNDAIQVCKVDDEGAFAVRIPPNHIELINSAKISKALAKLREFYDYIILVLPPDGILLVSRQDYCTTTALTNAVNH